MPISADLGSVLEQYVETLVSKGRYNSKSEVLREGVRLVQEREARLAHVVSLIEEGIADAEAGRMHDADEVFADIRAMIDAKIKTRA